MSNSPWGVMNPVALKTAQKLGFPADPSEIERLPNHDRIIFGDVNAEIEGLKFGAGFLLFISNGAIKMLEGYSHVGPWPAEIKRFVLTYADGSERNFNEVAEVFTSKASQSANTKER
jgi:hypothetical protein